MTSRMSSAPPATTPSAHVLMLKDLTLAAAVPAGIMIEGDSERHSSRILAGVTPCLACCGDNVNSVSRGIGGACGVLGTGAWQPGSQPGDRQGGQQRHALAAAATDAAALFAELATPVAAFDGSPETTTVAALQGKNKLRSNPSSSVQCEPLSVNCGLAHHSLRNALWGPKSHRQAGEASARASEWQR